MWKEVFRGYEEAELPKMTKFQNGADGIIYNEMLIDTGYFFSHCEHHMVPFFGEYSYGYIPDKWIIGASKISRIVDHFSARLQVAERLVCQIVDTIEKEIQPKGSILIMKARHLCKEMRGVKKYNTPFEAIAVRGYFLHNINHCKDEFLTRVR
jgi:GTP cyclohydrolase I